VLRGTGAAEGLTSFTGEAFFTPDGGRLVVPLTTHEAPLSRVAVLDVGTGKRVAIFGLDAWTTLALSADGRTLAAARAGADLRLVDLDTGTARPVADGRAGDHAGAVAFSPDGSLLLTWEPRGRAALRDPDGGRRLRTIDVHQEAVGGFAFSPDGLWLATGGANGLVALWDVVSGDQVWAQAGHPEPVTSLGFAGPRRLVTAAADLTALVWDARPDERPKGPAWDALAGPDPRAAYQAIWALAGDPRGPALVRSKVRPVPPVAPGRVRQWVADLGAPRYAAREAATTALRDLGLLAEPGLRAERARTTDEEVRTRIDGLLAGLSRERSAAELVGARAVAVMELAGTAEARVLMAEWAAGAPGARLTTDAAAALRRLPADR
jgi:hypothetical protein